MEVLKRTLPAPCKDLNKLLPKRKRKAPPQPPLSRQQSPPDPPKMSALNKTDFLESLLAEMHDENACDVSPPLPPRSYPQINYYTTAVAVDPAALDVCQNGDRAASAAASATATTSIDSTHTASAAATQTRRTCIEPRLLLRQAYKIATDASAVVGLESIRDFKPSIYLVNQQADSVSLTFEDFLSLRCSSVCQAIDRYLSPTDVGYNHHNELFTPYYLDTVLVEPVQNGSDYAIALCNYHMKTGDRYCNRVLPRVYCESDIVRQDYVIYLRPAGWTAFKRIFDCVETYFNLCLECCPVVQHLINRYSRFLTKHYKTKALLATSNCLLNTIPPSLEQELIHYVSKDLPLFIEDLNESRLSSEKIDYFYESSPLRQALTPWIDAEVRRFCVLNIVECVLENLKYVARW